MSRVWGLNLKVIAMTVRRENWNNPEPFKAVIIIGIVMTRFGSLQWTSWGRTPTNMAFLRVTLQHINDTLQSVDYKPGVPSDALRVQLARAKIPNLCRNCRCTVFVICCVMLYGATLHRCSAELHDILTSFANAIAFPLFYRIDCILFYSSCCFKM